MAKQRPALTGTPMPVKSRSDTPQMPATLWLAHFRLSLRDLFWRLRFSNDQGLDGFTAGNQFQTEFIEQCLSNLFNFLRRRVVARIRNVKIIISGQPGLINHWNLQVLCEIYCQPGYWQVFAMN